MSRPTCVQHPDGRVRRNGYYGKNNDYVKWQCVPEEGAPHYLSQEMTPKLVGGLEGHCLECGRQWRPTDGMDIAERDRFTLREKAFALTKLGDGLSYRKTSDAVRKRAGHLGGSPTRDGRLCRDWVSQYAPILADHYLPTEWPDILLLDELPFHISASSGVQSGTHAFSVFGAMGYGEGTFEEALAAKGKPRPVLWGLHASERRRAADWKEFFERLDGEPVHVVCDQAPALVNAVEDVWPNARVYASTTHLTLRLQEIMRNHKLRDTEPHRVLGQETFSGSGTDAYGDFIRFRKALEKFLAADHSDCDDRQITGVKKLKKWLANNHSTVVRSLVEWHWPVSVGALERALKEVKAALYYRRYNLRNMDRLQDLLTLLQLTINDLDDERRWEEELRHNHEDFHWAPPPRRQVDDPSLATRPFIGGVPVRGPNALWPRGHSVASYRPSGGNGRSLSVGVNPAKLPLQ